MNTMKLPIRPEVSEFVDRVRARLADLTDEEREELVGGLEADLAELVADGGCLAELGDPRAYADELRAAAGLERSRGRGAAALVRRPRRPVSVALTDLLDGARERWEARAATLPWLGAAWEVVVQLRPAWWVLRAWVAVQLLDRVTGPPWEGATLLPRFGDDLSGLVLLLGAVVGSALMGLRKVWPASRSPRSVLARLSLLGLNGFAVLALIWVGSSFPSAAWLHQQSHPRATGLVYAGSGIYNDGREVRNVFAYDAEGNPIEGVQLFDQAGEPLAVNPDARRMRYQGRLPMTYPWQVGGQTAWNVYPLPVRFGDRWQRSARAWTSAEPPFLPQPPLVAVPPASLPLPETEEPGAEEPRAEEPGAEERGAEGRASKGAGQRERR